jgi:hypothetical protein
VREILGVDGNGNPTERRWIGGREVIVHYADLPESDIVVKDGLRVTTPLRTMIDLAPEVEQVELARMVDDCLRRRLFTLEEAWVRLAESDMQGFPGGIILRKLLFG